MEGRRKGTTRLTLGDEEQRFVWLIVAGCLRLTMRTGTQLLLVENGRLSFNEQMWLRGSSCRAMSIVGVVRMRSWQSGHANGTEAGRRPCSKWQAMRSSWDRRLEVAESLLPLLATSEAMEYCLWRTKPSCLSTERATQNKSLERGRRYKAVSRWR